MGNLSPIWVGVKLLLYLAFLFALALLWYIPSMSSCYMGKMTVIPACHRLNIYTLAVCSRQTKEKCLFVAKNGINNMFLLALTRYSSYISHEHIQKKKKTPQSSINYAKSCMTKTPHYMSRSFPIMAKVLVGLQSKRLRSFKRRWKECRKSVNNGWQGEKNWLLI